MGLAEHTPSKRRPTGMPCSVQSLLDSLSESDRAELNSWLSSGFSQEAIFKALKDAGHVVGKQTINRHRSQSCRCFS